MRRAKVQVHLWRPGPAGDRLHAIFQRGAARGGYWQPITGNVEPGETPEACALRETAEEAGVEARPESLSPRLWVHDWSRGDTQFAEHVFALRCAAPEVTLSREHQTFAWLDYPVALERLQFEGNRRGLAMAEAWLSARA